MMQDSIEVRVKDAAEVALLTPQATLDFIEALSISNKENKTLATNLAKILRKSDHAMANHEVPLFAISYFADFDLKISEGLHAKLFASL